MRSGPASPALANARGQNTSVIRGGFGRTAAAAVLLALVAAGCSEPRERVLHDDLGRTVAVRAPIRRVVSLAPNVTEVIDAVGSVGSVVATDDFSNRPASVVSLPKVGGLEPSVERIVAVRPDLVIASASGNHPRLASALAAVDVPLFVVRTDRLDEIRASLSTLGGLLGSPGTAQALAHFDERLVRERRVREKKPRVLFLLWASPLYVAGRETFIDDVINVTGAENCVAPSAGAWPQYSLEALVADPPDLILFAEGSLSRERLAALFRDDPRWASIGAVQRGAVFGVNEDLFSRPGPRIVEAAAELNGVLDRWDAGQ